MMDNIVMMWSGISIEDSNQQEIIYWDEQEWIDDPKVVYSIIYAISTLVEKGPEALRKRISRDEGEGI